MNVRKQLAGLLNKLDGKDDANELLGTTDQGYGEGSACRRCSHHPGNGELIMSNAALATYKRASPILDSQRSILDEVLNSTTIDDEQKQIVGAQIDTLIRQILGKKQVQPSPSPRPSRAPSSGSTNCSTSRSTRCCTTRRFKT